MPVFALALRSVLNRKATAGLVVFAIGVSVALLLGVERVRTEAKASFANTISGTDLIVGARSGALPLLLYSVFRIGNATNNISWKSYRALARSPEVAWTIPLSLGDSHRGFASSARNGAISNITVTADETGFPSRRASVRRLFDAVLGAEVAEALEYREGDPIVVSHGLGATGISDHDDKPFRVAGILARTGTPVDRTVHVSLRGIEAIHVDWQHGAPIPGLAVSADAVRKMKLTPKTITAFLVGLKSRLAVFGLQRADQRVPGGAAARDPPRRHASGTLGPDGNGGGRALGDLDVRRRDRSPLHDGDDAGEPRRAPARNGHPAFGRRTPGACVRAPRCRGRRR